MGFGQEDLVKTSGIKAGGRVVLFLTSDLSLIFPLHKLLGKWRSQLAELHFLSGAKSKY